MAQYYMPPKEGGGGVNSSQYTYVADMWSGTVGKMVAEPRHHGPFGEVWKVGHAVVLAHMGYLQQRVSRHCGGGEILLPAKGVGRGMCVCACVHARMRMCVHGAYTCVCVCMCVCICVCAYLCMTSKSRRTCIHVP